MPYDHCDPTTNGAYAYKPFPGSSHSWALEQVRSLPAGALRVLDVGAGTGEVLAAVAAARTDPVEAWAVEHPGVDVYEDRNLEVTSYLDVSVEDQVRTVAKALMARS